LLPSRPLRGDCAIYVRTAILALALLGLSLRAAETLVTVPPGTPFFAADDPNSPILAVPDQEVTLRSLEQRPLRPLRNPYFRGAHPLSFLVTIHRVALPDGHEAWVAPDLYADQQLDVILPRPLSSLPWLGAAVVLFLAITCILLSLARQQRLNEALQATSPLPLSRSLVLLGTLVLIQMLIFCWMRSMAGFVVPALTDEIDYFGIAQDLISRTPPAEWHFNISIAILYVPLILLTGAKSYLDIHPIVSTLNVAVFTPLTLVMAYFLIEKATRRPRVALATVACLLLLPLVFYPVEWHGKHSVFKLVPGLPFFGPASFRLYYYSVWSGWNGLADTASTFAVTLTLFLATFLRRRDWVYHAVIGAVFGLACFLRINNIFFAPVVAYLLWKRNADVPLRQILAHGLAAVATFLVCVAPQFVANHLQFGNFLTFPYVLHGNHASQGFEWSYVPSSTHFLMGTNWIYMAMGTIGLVMLCRQPAGQLFALWSVPLILFFCGYTVTGASPMRFTLTVYPALLAAFFFAAERGGFGKKPWLVWLGIVANALVCPCQRWQEPYGIWLGSVSYGHQLAVTLPIAVPMLSLVAILIGLHGKPRLFWLFALVVFHTGWWGGLPLLMIAALAMVVWDWAGDIRTHLLPPPDPATP